MTRNGLVGVLASVFLLFVVAASIAFPGPWNSVAKNSFVPEMNEDGFRLGLDLQGGAHLVYQADMSEISDAERGQALEGVRDVIERRVNAFGVSEPIVQTNRGAGGNYRVIVELAGVFDINDAIGLIGETPILEFKVPATALQTELTEEQQSEVDDAQIEEREAAEELLVEILEEDSFEEEQASRIGREVTVEETDDTFGALIAELEDDQEVGVIDGVYESGSDLYIVNYLGVEDLDGVETYQLDYILLPLTTASDILDIDGWDNTELSGKHVQNASVAFDPNTNTPLVVLNFNKEGSDLFADLTESRVNDVIGIFLDGEPISTPIVQQPIYGGEATITGNFTIQGARLLAQRLNAGALPVPIDLVSQQTVGPTLGALSLDRSINAALIGFALVALFMLAYYRFAGFLAVISLVVYGALNLALYKLLGVTLSLAGIAGFILSLGIAVDANVLIFERLKEELNAGRDLPTAIDEGFRRAWTSIRDGNLTTLIASVILFAFSTSFIKGFALTLGLGILVSMFTAIVVTRLLLKFAIEFKIFKNPKLYSAKVKN